MSREARVGIIVGKRLCRSRSESRGGIRGYKGEKIGRWHNTLFPLLPPIHLLYLTTGLTRFLLQCLVHFLILSLRWLVSLLLSSSSQAMPMSILSKSMTLCWLMLLSKSLKKSSQNLNFTCPSEYRISARRCRWNEPKTCTLETWRKYLESPAMSILHILTITTTCLIIPMSQCKP